MGEYAVAAVVTGKPATEVPMPGSFETSTSYFCAWGTDVQLSRIGSG